MSVALGKLACLVWLLGRSQVSKAHSLGLAAPLILGVERCGKPYITPMKTR
jgi:hypothetical protein